jgi:hypothetical protein
VQIWLRRATNEPDTSGSVFIELFQHPGEGQSLVSQTLPFNAIDQESITFTFDPQPGPPGQAYYLQIKTNGPTLHALGRAEDAYPKGQAYNNEQAVDADLSFRTSYYYSLPAAVKDLGNFLAKTWLALPLLLVLWLPGRLLLRLTHWDVYLDFGQRSAAAVGLSMAAIPLVMLWTTAVGFSWNRTTILAAFIVLVLVYILLIILGEIRFLSETGFLARDWLRACISRPLKVSPAALCVLAIFFISLFVRLAMVRDLAAPAWVDSVHHATLIRLILEQGAFPSSYQPYMNLETASYHPGFHSLATVFIWLSGLELSQALLLFGQVLNALTIFSVYLLTMTFTHDQVSGLVAALVTGLITPMPAYYASWGRYTQLAGLIILPAAFFFIRHWLDDSRENGLRASLQRGNRQAFFSLILAAIACGGLFLTHYRVVVYLACLILAYLITSLIQSLAHHTLRRDLWKVFGAIGLLALISVLATLPWWPSSLRSLFVPAVSLVGSRAPFSDFTWTLLTSGLGRYTLGLAVLGLLWAAFQRRWFALTLFLWIAFLLIAANLSVFSLPGGVLMNNTSVVIMLFMPISVACGYLVGWVVNGWHKLIPLRWQPAYWTGLLIAGAALAFIGGRSLLPLMNPITLLYRQADHAAMGWIAENIPPKETILINPFLWGYGLYAGSDGGAWVTPLSGRVTAPPPALYGLDFGDQSIKQVSEFNRQVIELASDPAALNTLLRKNSIRYVYLGARSGVLSPKILLESGLFRLLYEYEGTWVFEAG